MNYLTTYSYDPLGNLIRVEQGSQTRSYVYDSLSHMISATSPENGKTTYAYDLNGNPIERTDARGVKTTMTYDVLNRVRTKVFSGTTPEGTEAANATPPITYFYDVYSNLPAGAPSWPSSPAKGRMVGVTYGAGSEGTYYEYDAEGRIKTNIQRQGNSNYATTYFYNLAGAVTREERGSPARRRNVMYYDEAGRLSVLQTGTYSGNGIVLSNLVSDISYTPFGGLQSEAYGNGLIHSITYNNRQQPTEISLGSSGNPESIFRINYIFGTSYNVNSPDEEITLAQNNGNLARIKYFINGQLQYSQTCQYDPVNRLQFAVEHNNGIYNDAARAWYQTFKYDPYGNRGVDLSNTSDDMGGADGALQITEFSGENNRITRTGFVYDGAGNLIEEPGRTYKYNGENKIIEAVVTGAVTSQYSYDGNGRRVRVSPVPYEYPPENRHVL